MIELHAGWEIARCEADELGIAPDLTGLEWRPATVPGTAAGALGELTRDYDAESWVFRTAFDAPLAPEQTDLVLEFDGIATVSDVFLNGELILQSQSMWARHRVEVGDRLRAANELLVVCHALSPLLARSGRPRQRWRTRLVHDGNLRWFRTMIFGRSPGYAPTPAPVGPWRPVRLAFRDRSGLDDIVIRPRVDGEGGTVHVSARPRGDCGRVEVVMDGHRAELQSTGDGSLVASLRLGRVRRWWPHTHGEPVLYPVTLELDGRVVDGRMVGFRELGFADDILEDGPQLTVNDVPVFARGAVWTPPDLISLAPSEQQLRELLLRARDAGMNMLRVVGTGAYEQPAFHTICDELGILVWQDLMFASLDYPLEVEAFRITAEDEVRQVTADLAWRPSLAVLCGSHELEQQPAMLGLDPGLARHPFWEQTVPEILAEAGAECAYVRSTPCGGDVPFHANRGIAHYFGVGGYFQPLRDVRSAGVHFAAECLPFANVPDLVELPTHHPEWKAGVQRDAGPAFQLAPGFDFDDVRDFYLAELFRVDPVKLRRMDQDRYLELSRMASGEAMAEVMGEWRRADSPCRGALTLWMKDMVAGAGFGLLDHRGRPKVAYHHLRRALAPVAIWTTDEGLSGVAVHMANDRGEVLRARLRIALYHDLQNRVAEAEELIEIPPRGHVERTIEGMLGRFVDSALAFGFGPPAHDVIVASLESLESAGIISQAVRFPAGRPLVRDSAERMGVRVAHSTDDDGSASIIISAERLLYGVRLDIPGHEPQDNAFSVEPGVPRVIQLRPVDPQSGSVSGSLTSINLSNSLAIGPPTGRPVSDLVDSLAASSN